MILTLTASNLLGMIRDHFLAQYIPTGQLDIYYAAFRLPDLVFNILIYGAIAAAVVPILSRSFKANEKSSWELVANLLNIATLIVLIALVGLFFLLPILMPLIVPSFPTEKIQETIYLARWMLLSPLFFTISYIFGSVLNAKKRFLLYSLAPIVYNLSIIIFTLLLSQRVNVVAPIIGVIVGSFLHMLVQLPGAVAAGFRPHFKLNFQDARLKRILKLMLPRAVALGAGQIQLVIFTAIASSIAGAIAIYNLADNIQTVPIVIFGVSFATAAFPSLAHFGNDERSKFNNVLLKSAKAALFFLIPSSIFLFLLRAQIVRLILGYGYFGWSDTRQAADTLTFFALGVVAQGLIPLIARAYYALENTRYPMWSAIISVIIGVTVALFGFKGLGVAGLALGYAFASWVQLFILLVGLEWKTYINLSGSFWISVAKMLLLAIIASAVMQLIKHWYGSVWDIDKVYNLFVQTVVSAGVGILAYLGGAWLLKMPEIRK